MIILHGDDTSKSRITLNQFLQKQTGATIKFEAKKLDITALKQALNSHQLFQENTSLIVIYSLFSLPESSQKDKTISLLEKNQKQQILIWEDKQIAQGKLKLFSSAKIILCKTNPLIFKFLEKIGDSTQLENLEIILKNNSSEFIFAMIVRQTRLLLQAKTAPNTLKLAPWQKQRLARQAQKFSAEKLLRMHKKLYLIDKNIKTGNTKLDLKHLLETFIISIS